jgi:hypothetical protein
LLRRLQACRRRTNAAAEDRSQLAVLLMLSGLVNEGTESRDRPAREHFVRIYFCACSKHSNAVRWRPYYAAERIIHARSTPTRQKPSRIRSRTHAARPAKMPKM